MVRHDDADAPVPLTEDEVAALTRGQMPDERIAAILDAKPRRLEAEPSRGEPAAAVDSPVEVTLNELDALAHGREVEAVARRIEKAAGEPREADQGGQVKGE